MQTLTLASAPPATFITALEALADPRDPRGRRHSLIFVVCAVTIAIMAGRSTVSGIERFMRNRIDWLAQLTRLKDAKPISRAHLPRLLARLDWDSLNPIIEIYCGVKIQLKGNQSILKQQLQQVVACETPVGSYTTIDKGHGRCDVRRGRCFDVSRLEYAKRWGNSGLASLMVIERKTKTQRKTTDETSFYLSNQRLTEAGESQGRELFDAIRGHWQIESDNWVRDVTFQEDSVRTKSGNQAQVMSGLRTLAMQLFRKVKVPNMRAALDNFCDNSRQFGEFLERVGFL